MTSILDHGFPILPTTENSLKGWIFNYIHYVIKNIYFLLRLAGAEIGGLSRKSFKPK
jgi:hypothetical protein